MTEPVEHDSYIEMTADGPIGRGSKPPARTEQMIKNHQVWARMNYPDGTHGWEIRGTGVRWPDSWRRQQEAADITPIEYTDIEQNE